MFEHLNIYSPRQFLLLSIKFSNFMMTRCQTHVPDTEQTPIDTIIACLLLLLLYREEFYGEGKVCGGGGQSDVRFLRGYLSCIIEDWLMYYVLVK